MRKDSGSVHRSSLQGLLERLSRFSANVMMAVIVSVLLSFSYRTESESEEEGQLEDLWSKLSAHSNTAP